MVSKSGGKITPSILLGPRLKADRAKAHINEIIRLSEPLHPSLYTIRNEAQVRLPELNPRFYHLTYRPKKPIPEIFALVIGDAIHNLRSALDHLASGVIRANKPSATPFFPAVKRENLESSGWLEAMETALPGSKKLILEDIRPVNDSRERFWNAVQSLDIDDKHNLVVPTVTTVSLDYSASSARQHWESCTRVTNAAHPFVIAACTTPISIDRNPEISVCVTFGQGTHVQRESVVPTLLDIQQMVSETIDAFADLIIRDQS